MAKVYSKVSDSEMKISETVENVEVFSIDALYAKKSQYESELVAIQSELDEVNKKITEAEKLGITK